MSKKCEISGKGRLNGSKVSHSKIHSRKMSFANLQYKRLYDSENKRWVRLRVSSRILKTIDKKGLSATLRDAGLTIDDLK